jgi:protein-disulfide isomerase
LIYFNKNIYGIIYKMGEAKGLVITAFITLFILGGGILLFSKGQTNNPKPVSKDILVKSDSHQTNKDAEVSIVEFGDYRCPACKQSFPIIQQVVKDYGDKINFVFRNYAFLPDPGSTNPNASSLAALSAECAADQNKFWEMHDFLYQNQPPESDIKMYNTDNLSKSAATLGLDEAKFKSCISAKKYEDRVKEDFADGELAGVTGTPSFFINGILLPGVPAYNDFKSVLDPLLNQK